jgi:hypothetical protein
MKKVLVAAFALVSLTVNAQKGTLLVGGNVGISSAKYPSTPNDNKSTSFVFNPTVGYQFNDNWTTGILADIASQKTTNSLNVESKSSRFGVGPFIRYTKTLSSVFSVYGQAQSVFGTTKWNGSKTGTYADVNLFPAVFINVKNGFGLNLDFGGIGFSSNTPTGGSASTAFNFNFGSTAHVGISKNFSFKIKK